MRCKAKAKSTGNQCARSAIAGGEVCRVHGGAAPQVRAKAEERLAAMVDPALARLLELLERKGKPADNVVLAAVKDVLDRNGLGAKQMHEISGPGGGPIPSKVTVHIVDPKGDE